jgi:hypothetical protein
MGWIHHDDWDTEGIGEPSVSELKAAQAARHEAMRPTAEAALAQRVGQLMADEWVECSGEELVRLLVIDRKTKVSESIMTLSEAAKEVRGPLGPVICRFLRRGRNYLVTRASLNDARVEQYVLSHCTLAVRPIGA